MTTEELLAIILNKETKDHGSSILNDIINKGYDMHLVTCPQCGQIHSFVPDEYEHTHTCHCGTEFSQDEAPDLFFF